MAYHDAHKNVEFTRVSYCTCSCKSELTLQVESSIQEKLIHSCHCEKHNEILENKKKVELLNIFSKL